MKAAAALSCLAGGSLAAAGTINSAHKIQKRALHTSDPHYPSPWMNPDADGWAEAYAQARDFVSQLTLPEKVNLTTGVGWQGEQCVGQTGAIPRFGLRSLCMHDAPLGIRGSDYNSAFPSGQTAAATWDRGLMYRRGYAMGKEAKGKGINVLLGPVAGPIGRMPAAGRNWEGFAPDPVLTGVGMSETVKGTQDAGVVACAKHFIGNEQENFRQRGEAQGYGYDIDESLSSNIDDKTMHELYLWPFADAVRAGVGSIMCSYQQVNNSYGCQNSKLLNDLLKNELGFQGFVMSDWQAQHTGAASAVAGLDMTMPGDTTFNTGLSFWGTNLTLAVLNGTVPAYRVDDMAMRIMASIFKVSKTTDFDPINFSFWTLDTYGPVHWVAKEGYQEINSHVDVREDHGKLIREIAAKGTVLLKNSGALPLQKPKFVAVIGEDAGGNPNGPNGCGDRGCDDGTLAMGWGSGTANFPYLITPDAALQARAIEDGSRYESILSNYAHDKTDALVSQANVTAIVFVNADSGEGYINVDGNMGDRKNLTLWKNGDDLVKRVSGACSNTIVVIHSTGPVLLTEWYESPNITAILWAGLPGQESGNSIADVLYGDVNPAARSPFTWGKTREAYGADVLYEPNNGNGAPQQDFSEGVFIDYRYFDKQNSSVIYEFGHGLSYTTFEYSNIRVEKSNAGEYKPTTGSTAAAPTFGNFSTDLKDYLFPKEDFSYIYQYIYPYVNTTDAKKASADPHYGQTAEEFLPLHAVDADAQPLLRSSGRNSPGGNRQLYDIVYTITADITNTGAIVGEEVPQLYVALGGPEDPKVQLRDFDRMRIDPGETKQFTGRLTRRDLSNWDIEVQDWVVSEHKKTAFVGKSSRKLDLKIELP
ncbi:glycosyl hydrolase family 3 N terminal domain-containing protein [Chaetomium tenue]|uniref:Glycosyl hydrolase family 3 N terminal domain-containing protein n=1 Tax=Chaetomium tenue TaxID=1854479 RepID=A0ACB7PCH7_9PEZI|nr:glycosyl hydrolase family 3 N terminal domain-containing protein [Chaetomium globosum]